MLDQTCHRREMLTRSTLGFGAVALAQLLFEDGLLAAETGGAAEATHRATARRVIFLFMGGGPSQVDTFDPKPTLNKLHGQKVPESFTQGKRFAFIKGDAKVLGSPQKFAKTGQCGIDISHLLPHHREIADDVFTRLRASTREDNKKALQDIRAAGLASVPFDAAAVAEFQKIGDRAAESCVGKLYSADLLARVRKTVAEVRAPKSGGAGSPGKS